MPINADFYDVYNTSAYLLWRNLGYVLPQTNYSLNLSPSSSGSVDLYTTNRGGSSTIYFHQEPGTNVYNGTISDSQYNIDGSIRFPVYTGSLSSAVSLPIMNRARSVDEDSQIITDLGEISTSLDSSGNITDCYLLSVIIPAGQWLELSVTTGTIQQIDAGYANGNTSFFSFLIYDSSGDYIPSTRLISSHNPEFVLPVYAGQLRRCPDDLLVFAGLDSYSFRNKLLNELNSIKDIISSGSSESSAVVDDISGSNSEFSSSSDSLHNAEQSLFDSFTSSLISPDTSFISDLSSTASWVTRQFDRLIASSDVFSAVLVVSLTLGIALVIVGKMRG